MFSVTDTVHLLRWWSNFLNAHTKPMSAVFPTSGLSFKLQGREVSQYHSSRSIKSRRAFIEFLQAGPEDVSRMWNERSLNSDKQAGKIVFKLNCSTLRTQSDKRGKSGGWSASVLLGFTTHKPEPNADLVRDWLHFWDRINLWGRNLTSLTLVPEGV